MPPRRRKIEKKEIHILIKYTLIEEIIVLFHFIRIEPMNAAYRFFSLPSITDHLKETHTHTKATNQKLHKER